MKKRRPRASRTLRCESLEPRHMMAVSATLAGGVLDVVGTDGDDTINFFRSGQYIYIQGVDDAWKASQVKSIQVDTLDGDDIVSFDSKTNGGTRALKESTAVVGGLGTELVRTGKTHDLYFSGYGNYVEFDGKHKILFNGVDNVNSHVTAKRTDNVLQVDATHGDEDIYFAQVDGRIYVSGVAKSFKATKIGSIVVKLQDGDHTVSFDSLANGGNQALAKFITVYAQSGTNTVVLADGSELAIDGAHTLQFDLAGNCRMDGQDGFSAPAPNPPAPPADWFDTNIADAGLRTLGDTLWSDSVIDRSDMLSLLANAQIGGVINATKLNDLKKIVDNRRLFGAHHDVWTLSNYIVDGNSANAHYQGQTLGNLVAGSPSTQLEKLVNKWFLGLDRPVATSDMGPTYGYRQASGSLFVNGASYTDIRQGGLSDDYFLASLAETALKNPAAIENMFIVNGDGTYTVRFFHGSEPEYVTVDSYLPTDSSGFFVFATMGARSTSTSNELWVALAEKAYVQLNEMAWLRPESWGGGANTYTGISGGCMYQVLNQITGQATIGYQSVAGTMTAFASAFNSGKSIAFGSKTTPGSSIIVGNHAYAVLSVITNNQTVQIFNPWGLNNGHDGGVITLTWSQVQASFDWYDRTA